MRHYRSFFRNAGLALAGVMFFAACRKDEKRDVLVYSGTTGDCTWAVTGVPGDYTLEISGEGAMANYDLFSGEAPFAGNVPWYQHDMSIKTLVIGSGVTDVNVEGVKLCHGLTAIRVDAANVRYSVMDSVLFDKEQATLVCYPAGKEGDYAIPASVVTIGDGAFKYCHRLTGVTIPGSVTGIGTLAFWSCFRLKNLTIPASVTGIGSEAFGYCSDLRVVTNLNPEPQNGVPGIFSDNLISSHFAFSWVDVGACTLRVPADAVGAYEAHPEWRKFGNIEAI